MAVLKGVHYKSLLFSGFIAGYAMSFVDFWFSGFLGWFNGSMAALHNGTWNMFVAHQIDSVIFAWVFAAFAIKFLPGSGWLKGGIYGILLGIAVTVAMMIDAAGGGGMGKMMTSMPPSAMIGFFVTHIVYGVMLGLLYNNEHCVDKNGQKCCC